MKNFTASDYPKTAAMPYLVNSNDPAKGLAQYFTDHLTSDQMVEVKKHIQANGVTNNAPMTKEFVLEALCHAS